MQPWVCNDKEKFQNILLLNQTVKNKERQFWDLLYDGKKPKTEEEDSINKEGIIKLLSGGTVEAGKLFCQKEFEEKFQFLCGNQKKSFN